MSSIADAIAGKPPLGATLAQGVAQLSANQTINFQLYKAYDFPLDGMRYWLAVPPTASGFTAPTAGVQAGPGLASATVQPGEAIQVVSGSLDALNILGGVIVNPPNATEPLFVDPTGPAYAEAGGGGTTIALPPGASFTLPPAPSRGVWVNAATGGHQFTVVVQRSTPSVSLPIQVPAQGSFHYDAAIDQREDAVVDRSTVIFTALEEIQAFNDMGTDYLYIATYRDLTFAFSSRGRLYEQADLFHYMGTALFSVAATQIIADPTTFNPALVVSNSLPIWLGMNGYVPPYPGFTCPLPLYPSFLAPKNLKPPFASIDISKTEGLQASPTFGPHLEQASLSRDTVAVTLYGANNQMALDFLSFVLQYSRDWELIGMASMPTVTDEKFPQPEMQILAQRKRIEFLVNYDQGVSRNQARQFIERAKVQFIPAWLIN